MSLQGEKTRALYQRAKRVMPYGINSNFRYWGDDTLVITGGDGPYIWDADGKRYIDYRLGFGPIILGHAYQPVVEAVQRAAAAGTVFAWTTPGEIELAERITRMCKVDRVRLANTGTEATMHALRIARAHTGREKFIKFEGHYHGMSDYFLYSTASSPSSALGSPRSPTPSVVSSGVPKGILDYVYVLPFNDFEALDRTVRAGWGEIATIIVEPMMGNSAGILPQPGYLEHIRALCDEYGIVMIMDEVKTGFRLANGGAQEYFNIRADLVTYAKSMGNGFPVAAIAGKEEVMMTITPGGVAQGGTYVGNSIATAAANATLQILEEQPIIETIHARGRKLMDGIDAILTEAGLPHHVTGAPTLFGYVMGTDAEPQDFRDYCAGDEALYSRLAYALIERGVIPDSDGREPWFMCYAHDEAIVDETLNIFNDAVQAVK